MLTVGQYLQPRPGNLAVQRYVAPQQFEAIARAGTGDGICACGLRAARCARATTPTGRPTRPASELDNRISRRHPWTSDPIPQPLYKSLYFQVITAIVIGVLLGHFYPQTGEAMKPLGDGFIKLIKMIIAPIIFCTVVVGIAGMEDMKKVGKTGGLALLYFEIVSSDRAGRRAW